MGGGTAGLAVAARLAEAPSTSVAVIEAGSFYELDNGNGSVIPALCTLQQVGTDADITQPLIDWNFVTTPQAVSLMAAHFQLLNVFTGPLREQTIAECTTPEGRHSGAAPRVIIWSTIGRIASCELYQPS